jgi:hypothetical protein
MLRLKSHMHLWRMLRGEMRETPEMRAAVIRARARARAAFAWIPPVKSLVEYEQAIKYLEAAEENLRIARGLL